MARTIIENSFHYFFTMMYALKTRTLNTVDIYRP